MSSVLHASVGTSRCCLVGKSRGGRRHAPCHRLLTRVRCEPPAKSSSTEEPSPSKRATDSEDEDVGMGLRPYQASPLISENWEGDQYRGSNWNILTVILGLTFLIPVIGLLFAYLTYGTLWSSTGNYGNVYFY